MNDPYEILGVSHDASGADIKRAFRRLSRRYHPDTAGSNPENVARFQAVSQAFATLSRGEARGAYDGAHTSPESSTRCEQPAPAWGQEDTLDPTRPPAPEVGNPAEHSGDARSEPTRRPGSSTPARQFSSPPLPRWVVPAAAAAIVALVLLQLVNAYTVSDQFAFGFGTLFALAGVWRVGGQRALPARVFAVAVAVVAALLLSRGLVRGGWLWWAAVLLPLVVAEVLSPPVHRHRESERRARGAARWQHLVSVAATFDTSPQWLTASKSTQDRTSVVLQDPVTGKARSVVLPGRWQSGQWVVERAGVVQAAADDYARLAWLAATAPPSR